MSNLQQLVEIVAQLRGPKGCPWDRQQTHRSMRPYLLEEVYEVLDALDQEAPDTVLEEELGDLLFVVLLLCQIGDDQKQLSLESVAARIADKMVTRHPHVFDPAQHSGSGGGGTLADWESRKAARNARIGRLGGVPRTLPALLRAHRQAEKASAVGFDWPDHEGVFDKIHEEIAELREALAAHDPRQIEAEYGDLLLSVANLGRHIGASPEEALRGANDRFRDRFSCVEDLARERSIALEAADAQTLDSLWEEAKRSLRARGD